MGAGDREARGLSDLTARAVRAAVSTGRRHGLRCDDPAVLSDRGNAIVWLRPSPVVARVATLTARTRRDPAAWLAREVLVARHLADAGGPVVPPSDAVDPGPHAEDGLALTLWRHVDVSPLRPTPAEAGEALAEFHAASASLLGGAVASDLGGRPLDGAWTAHGRGGVPPGSADRGGTPLAELTPVRDQIADAIDALDAALTEGSDDAGSDGSAVGSPDHVDVAALRREHDAVLAGLPVDGPYGVLHGDAHPGNLVSVAGRWVWADLEEACRGPLAWDLAVLAGTTALDGAAAVREYAAITRVTVPDLEPWARARRLEGAVWALGMARHDPARYASVAAALVARLDLG